MVATDKVFAGSIPELYDRLLVPLIFEPYASDLATRIAEAAPRDVLETAAGTGALTTAMVSRLPAATGSSQPTSISPCWTTPRRNRRFRAGSRGSRRTRWRCRSRRDIRRRHLPIRHDVLPGQGQGLQRGASRAEAARPFPVQRLGPDLRQSFRRCRDGSPDARCSRRIRRYSWRAPRTAITMSRASAKTCPPAAFRISRSRRSTSPARPSRARDVAIAYCQGTPLRNEIVARDASRLEEATNVADAALAKRFGNGAIEGLISAHVIAASA